MTKISKLIAQVAYIMGVLAVVLSLVYAAIPRLPNPVGVTSRGLLVFAITLFLCTIASHLITREGR